MRSTVVVSLLLGATFLAAGCIDLGDVKLESTLDDVYRFAGYHFQQPWGMTDGANSTHPWLATPEAVPIAIQQMMKGQGSDMSVTVTKKGTMLTSIFEKTYVSTDHGVNWTQVHDLKSTGYPRTEDRMKSFGVAVHADPLSDRIYLSHLNGWLDLGFYQQNCAFLLYSDDEGKTWKETQTGYWPMSCATQQQAILEQRLVTAKPGKDTVYPASLIRYPSVLYICGTIALTGPKCSMSFDGGETFAYEARPVTPPELTCNVVSLGVPAALADGTVVVPLGISRNFILAPGCSTFVKPTVAVTTDSGLTWKIRTCMSCSENTDPAPKVVFTSDGTGYLTFRDAAYRIQLLRSKNLFQTWDAPIPLSAPGTTLSSHGTLVAGDNGRISVAYLATFKDQKQANYYYGRGVRPEFAAQESFWHLFFANTANASEASPAFVVQQVTPQEDPVHIGCLVNFPPSSFYGRAVTSERYDCRQALNFLESDLTPEGRFVLALSDACAPKNGCTIDTSGGYQARERTPSMVIQDAGTSLLLDKGILLSLGLKAPQPEPRDCCPKGN